MSEVEAGSEAPSYLPPVDARRRRWPRATATVVVVASLVGGLVALVTMRATAGASSPEAAVQRLADAASEEDLVGVLEALLPAEQDVLRDRVDEIAVQLRRLGILDDEVRLDAVSGLDVAMDDLELRAEPVSAEVAAVVVEGGTARLGVDGAELPIGPVLRSLLPRSPEQLPSPAPHRFSDDDLRLVAVRQDGAWYVSLAYSAAEAIRREAGKPAPPFGRGLTPTGAASPEAAVRALARAGAALDLRAAMALAAPGEADALHDYAPLFLPEVESDIERLRRGGGRVEMPVLEMSTDGGGERARVTIERLSVRGDTPDGPWTLNYDGNCMRFGGAKAEQARPVCRDPAEPGVGMGSLFAPFRLTTVQWEGAWYVSPAGSYLDSFIDSLRGLDRQRLERMMEEGGAGLFYGLLFPVFFPPVASPGPREYRCVEAVAPLVAPSQTAEGGEWFGYTGAEGAARSKAVPPAPAEHCEQLPSPPGPSLIPPEGRPSAADHSSGAGEARLPTPSPTPPPVPPAPAPASLQPPRAPTTTTAP